jgi:hypothetical protein
MTRNRLRALVLAGAVLAGGPVLAACGDDNDAGGMGEDSEPIEENQDNAGDTSGDQSGYNEP